MEAIEYYEECETLLRSFSWKYSNGNESMREELFSQANLLFWKVFNTIETITTTSQRKKYVGTVVANGLRDFISKQGIVVSSDDSAELRGAGDPFRSLALKDAIQQLSDEGQYVAEIFIEGKIGLLDIEMHQVYKAPAPRAIRGSLARHLKEDKGWAHALVYATINEMKQMVREL